MTNDQTSYAQGHEWLTGLPCDLTKYSPERRADLEQAAKTVLALAPEPAPAAKAPEYEPVADLAQLPAGVPPVFGLCGKPRSGKDVVADYLVAFYQGVERLAFSDSIRDEVNDYLAGFPYLTDDDAVVHHIVEENKSEPQYRALLQAWGLGRREEDPHHWTKEVKRKVTARLAGGARLVIATGARMPTDIEVIEQLNGEVLRVVRPGNPYQAEHDVEKGLDDVPDEKFVTVLNSVEGDLRPYERNIRSMLHGAR